jgi:hypothetical protein
VRMEWIQFPPLQSGNNNRSHFLQLVQSADEL